MSLPSKEMTGRWLLKKAIPGARVLPVQLERKVHKVLRAQPVLQAQRERRVLKAPREPKDHRVLPGHRRTWRHYKRRSVVLR